MLLWLVRVPAGQFVSQGDYTEPRRACAIIRPTSGERNAVMRPDSLLSLVQTLRERIGEHRSALSSNEMLTRYALVDPLLYELGWDTSDPATVVPEDTSGLGRGRPDYVLRTNGQPTMVIEAKKLGSGLQNGARQAVDYAMDASRQARYFAITDGQNWEIYDTNRPANDMRVASFDIMASSPAEVCLKALALWRPSVEYGSVMAAETPIVGLDMVKRGVAESIVPQTHESEPTPQKHPATQRPPATVPQSGETGQVWLPLSEFKPQLHTSPPVEIQFPDHSNISIKRWNAITIEIVRWLFEHGFLNQNNWNIRQNVRYYVSDTRRHSSGKAFKNPHQIGPLWVEGDFTGVNHVKNSSFILKEVGQDPAQFKVRLSP